jgi:tetratricopeptide (TPR) repeat protein
LYQEAFNLNRQDPSLLAHVILTKAHLYEQNPNRKEDLKEIENLILKGRDLEPQLNAFYRAEAIVAFAQKNFDLALEKSRFARESNPSDVESLAIEAEALNESGDRTSAFERIMQAVEQKTQKLRVYNVAARVALDIGDIDKAIGFARAALLINPMHANTHYVLAEAYQKIRKTGPAIAHFDLVTKLAPLASLSILADAHFSLAKLLELQNNVLESSKHNKLAYYFSNGLLPGINEKVNSDDKDIAELKKLAKEQEYGAAFYSARAEEFVTEGNSILGLEYLQVVRLMDPENPAPLVKVADLLEKLAISHEKLKRVEILYLRAIKKDPNYLDGYCKLAVVETEQYNFDSAYRLLIRAGGVLGIEDLTSFIASGCRDTGFLSSESAEEHKVYLALGKHFFKRENYVCAAAFLKQARASSPVNSEIFFYFGKLSELYKGENLAEAVRYYFQAVSTDAENYEALAGWARVKTKVGEKNYVVKYIRALFEREPQNPQLFWVLGEAYAENQEFQRAITFYKKALDYNNRFSRARISLARALSAIGQTYQAVNEYSFAASTDRRNGVGFFEAAQLQTINKKYQDAELLIKELIETIPNYPGSHRLLSQIYQFQGRKDPAISEMLIEVKNNPQNTKFTRELAEIYVKYQEFEKAVTVLTKLTNLPGEVKGPEFRLDRTQALLLLSRCYRELKRPENAEGAIRLALDVDPNDPELHRELGYVYLALQRNREGVKEFEFYIQRNPAGADVENIKRLIKTMAIEE